MECYSGKGKVENCTDGIVKKYMLCKSRRVSEPYAKSFLLDEFSN